VATNKKTFVKKLNFPGDRERIRLRTTLYALDMLRRELSGLQQQ
jgi:nicotinamide mononucleotide (NMN) deamidase PncC